MTLFKDKYRIESTRLPEYDYSQPGYYFVTICSFERECIFGKIENDKMKLSPIGMIIKKFIPKIKQYFINADIDTRMIMPNHLHIIMIINEYPGGVCARNFNVNHYERRDRRRDGVTPSLPVATPFSSLPQTPPINHHPTLGQIVGYYKYQTAKAINLFRNTPGLSVWQKNYYEHIIRDESELNRIREYIRNNPINWQSDRNNINKNI